MEKKEAEFITKVIFDTSQVGKEYLVKVGIPDVQGSHEFIKVFVDHFNAGPLKIQPAYSNTPIEPMYQIIDWDYNTTGSSSSGAF